MHRIALAAAAAACLFSSLEARAGTLDQLTYLCKSNPGCTRLDDGADGTVNFRIVRNGRILRLTCASDGNCTRSYPKGRQATVADTAALLGGQ